MQIVIDIPEEIYIHLLARYKYQNTDDIGLSELDKVGVSIKNGTPLPIGKWIKYNVDIAPHPLHCSECGWSDHHLNRTIVSDFKYCPNCGTRMEVNADANSD